MKKPRTKDDKWYQTLTSNIEPYKRTCKCGHVVVVTEDKKLCTHCGNYVFRNKEEEFKYRMKEKLTKSQ